MSIILKSIIVKSGATQSFARRTMPDRHRVRNLSRAAVGTPKPDNNL